MKKILSMWFGLFLSIGVLAFLTGCETMQGAGRDVQSAGEAIEEAAR
ncbi:MAG: entericidin A/B family lipoprotein [Opitutales bacterium]|nr:entericidin A/B family lipoprotein [Opitutales bacterium]